MENNKKSFRKPYVRPVKANWWTDRAFYIAYMLREGTAFLGAWIALEFLIIIFAPTFGLNPKIATVAILSNPIVILLNIISLVGVLYHAITWFNLMPKAVRVFTSGNPTNTKLIPEKLIVLAQWGGFAVASVVIIIACCLA